jgi:hypothetical protein
MKPSKDDFVYRLPVIEPHRKKVIIAGSRGFKDRKLLFRVMNKLTFWFEDVVVISGTQKTKGWNPVTGKPEYYGADYLGEEWAHSKRYTVVRFHPEWDKHGDKAGVLRNIEMVKFADAAVIFWDGVSKGSFNMINLCKRYKLKLKVVRYNE